MRILLEFVLVTAIFAVITLLWRTAGRVCFTPVPKADGIDSYILLRAMGSGDSLEEIVESLKWVNGTVKLGGQIVIVDCGLTDYGKRIAAILSEDRHCVQTVTPDELNAFISG